MAGGTLGSEGPRVQGSDGPRVQGSEGPVRTFAWTAAALAVPAVAATLVLDHLYQQQRPDQASKAFELLAISAAVVVALAAWRAAARWHATPVQLIPVAAMAAVLSMAAVAVVNAAVPSWDYRCYEAAAQLVRARANPYPSSGCYIYPPPLAVGLAWSAAAVGRVVGETAAWPSTFVLFEAAQIVAVGAAFVLLFSAARSWRSPTGAILTAALLIVNVPLLDTIANHQINAIVLALACGAVALADGAAWAAGLCVGIGAVLKLYPVVLVPVLWAAGRRAAAIASAAWIALAVLLVGEPRWWFDFAGRLASRPAGFPSLSDNSVFSLVANGARLVSHAPTSSAPPRWATAVWIVWAGAVALYGAPRLLARERDRRGSGADEGHLFAQMADVLALSLAASPLAWPHHYVLALPATIAAALRATDRERVIVAAGAFLMFAVPIFHVWLLSEHRLVGLALVLYAGRPKGLHYSCQS